MVSRSKRQGDGLQRLRASYRSFSTLDSAFRVLAPQGLNMNSPGRAPGVVGHKFQSGPAGAPRGSAPPGPRDLWGFLPWANARGVRPGLFMLGPSRASGARTFSSFRTIPTARASPTPLRPGTPTEVRGRRAHSGT